MGFTDDYLLASAEVALSAAEREIRLGVQPAFFERAPPLPLKRFIYGETWNAYQLWEQVPESLKPHELPGIL